jgi:hypothetical protein
MLHKPAFSHPVFQQALIDVGKSAGYFINTFFFAARKGYMEIIAALFPKCKESLGEELHFRITWV